VLIRSPRQALRFPSPPHNALNKKRQSTHITLLCLIVAAQVYAENLVNTPGLEVSFTDPDTLVLTEESKAILSMAPYKPTALVPFNDWNTPVETPAGPLVNELPTDRNGVARSTSNVLPGEASQPKIQPVQCYIGSNVTSVPFCVCM
jgi:hypothetical protein